jgi:hypothetical protein
MIIKITGIEHLEARLKRMTAETRSELERATHQAVLYVHSQLPPYPAPPPNSTYRRTGTLGRTITTEVRSLGNDVVGAIGTNTVYAPWVISDKPVGSRGPQAWMHVGRWWTLQQVVRDAKDAIMDIYRDALRRIVG